MYLSHHTVTTAYYFNFLNPFILDNKELIFIYNKLQLILLLTSICVIEHIL